MTNVGHKNRIALRRLNRHPHPMTRTTPLQNRVTPTGEICAHSARGTLMGNRGILHDDRQQLGTARWKHQAWVTCTLAFKARRRELMAPGWYTELFFTDEAVALAAGHRPCAECRREDFNRFREAFAKAHPDLPHRAPDMDRVLHKARVMSRSRKQVTFEAKLLELPEGVFFRAEPDGAPLVCWQGRVWAWAFEGYAAGPDALPDRVEVLTPAPTVKTIVAGYMPVCIAQ
ncbi:hypothetical protein [Maricaulis maris]|uniref:Uncharacterized protein n=1 Tax=Maricaulis maris TaxID=74318 RepID=A0A495D5N0_9PROT|nr:hypothetical protein [Maricaulis maris]RKQ96132.1 hypothetical protein C7435_2384 [Maricaulis maris]